jgi:hypothetical protein
MGGGQLIHIEYLTAGGELAMEQFPVPGGFSYLVGLGRFGNLSGIKAWTGVRPTGRRSHGADHQHGCQHRLGQYSSSHVSTLKLRFFV